jgi:hypothetical protein
MSVVDPKLAPRTNLPPELQELLAREAVFFMSRKRIGDALSAARQGKAAKLFVKPLLSLFGAAPDPGQDSRPGRAGGSDSRPESVELLEAGLKKIEDTLPALSACVDRSMENFLREYDPEYVNGLAASRYIEDWRRLLDTFSARVGAAMEGLYRLRAVLGALPGAVACGASEEGRQAIEVQVIRMQEVHEDILFINKIADAQRMRSGIDGITLYRQPERNWAGSVTALQFAQPPAAVEAVTGLLADLEEVSEKVRIAVQGECQLASYASGLGVTSYQRRVWVSLREAAHLLINPENMEAVISETEQLIDAGKLLDWRPVRAPVEPSAVASANPPAKAPGASTTASGDVPAGTPPPPLRRMTIPADTPGIPARPSKPPPGVTVAPTRFGRGPELRLPSRGAGAPVRPKAEPVTSPGAVPLSASPFPVAAKSDGSVPPEATAETIADLMAERKRLEQILLETRASLTEREQFLSESEARLMKVSQTQLEREVDLEQREEQLRDLEKRLREMQTRLATERPATTEKKVWDEFRE